MDRRPPDLVYQELQEGTIQLQGLGLRSERTRPNGWQASWPRTEAIRRVDHFDRARPASAPMRRAISYCM